MGWTAAVLGAWNGLFAVLWLVRGDLILLAVSFTAAALSGLTAWYNLRRAREVMCAASAGELRRMPVAKGAPDTLGWRCWVWDMQAKELRSPLHGTLWPTPELRCPEWCEEDVVRGVAGVHAALVPEKWTGLTIPEAQGQSEAFLRDYGAGQHACIIIHGIVERFGRFVLGTEGWRAEWVIIRKLCAPTTEIGLALEATFPDVEIIYDR